MLFKRVNRSSPERVFIIGYNSSAATWSNGYWVRWDYSTDVNGVGMETPAAKGAVGVGTGISIAGVVAQTIAASSYGLVQVYGYHSAARVDSNAASFDKGQALQNIAADYSAGPMVVTGTTANCYPIGFIFEAYTLSATSATKKVFIKCL